MNGFIARVWNPNGGWFLARQTIWGLCERGRLSDLNLSVPHSAAREGGSTESCVPLILAPWMATHTVRGFSCNCIVHCIPLRPPVLAHFWRRRGWLLRPEPRSQAGEARFSHSARRPRLLAADDLLLWGGGGISDYSPLWTAIAFL